MKPISFRVNGVPIPKGSYRAFQFKNSKYPVITNANAKTKLWEQIVGSEALNFRPKGGVLDQAIAATLTFYLPRPKSKPASKYKYPIWKPDLDKLTRAIWDALTEILYEDDARICDSETKKRYAESPQDARVEIKLEVLP